jgi:hypothetical protein
MDYDGDGIFLKSGLSRPTPKKMRTFSAKRIFYLVSLQSYVFRNPLAPSAEENADRASNDFRPTT